MHSISKRIIQYGVYRHKYEPKEFCKTEVCNQRFQSWETDCRVYAKETMDCVNDWMRVFLLDGTKLMMRYNENVRICKN